MATDIKSIQETSDDLLDLVMAKGASFQEAYLASHGRYAQCIQTPKDVPVDGAKTPTDKAVKPHYQAESWQDLGFVLPLTSEISMRIDIYDGPKGHDWSATATFKANGISYSKTVAANGTETQTTDWMVSETSLIPFLDEKSETASPE